MDWITDVQKSLNNFLRAKRQEIISHGAVGALDDAPRVERLDDGSFRVVILAVTEAKTPAAPKTKKTRKKKQADDVPQTTDDIPF